MNINIINENNINNDTNLGNDYYYSDFDEKIPLKKNHKKFGKMKDI